jgi:hypothetical protein
MMQVSEKAYLHVPKTGGTAVIAAINSSDALYENGNPRIAVFGHEFNLGQLTDFATVFGVRDPIDRVVSGFYSRKREGRPRYSSPHTPAEAVVFKRWKEFEPLVLDYASGEPDARDAWKSIPHLRPMATWLGDAQMIKNSNIAYIADLESLGEDWSKMRAALGLPVSVSLPPSAFEAHRRLEDPPKLSRRARRLLKELLAEDYELFATCREIRKRRGWS